MTVSEAIFDISKRLGEPDGTKLPGYLIKSYFLKAISVVFLSDMVTESDYFGLSKYFEGSGGILNVAEPIRKILSIKGDTGSVRYIYKTTQEIDALVGSDFLDPEEGERFYYVMGSTVRFYGNTGGDSNVTLYYIGYPASSYDDDDDLTTIFSHSFIELSIREAIKQIMTEIGVLNDSK